MTTETTTSIVDKAKLGLAVALVGAGIWAYYWLSESALVLRLLALAGGFIAGASLVGSSSLSGSSGA